MRDPSEAPVDATYFKQAARRFASGVTVVTTTVDPGAVYGVTVSSFASLSINPLLVTVSLASDSRVLGYVQRSGRFAISVLRRDQRDVSQYFASLGRDPVPGGFSGFATTAAVTGAPIIEGCLSYFDCEVHEFLPGGDHKILVGRVMSAGGGSGEPLLYYDGGYHDIADRGARFTDGMSVQLHLAGIPPRELLDAQVAIEPATAELAARNATGAQLDGLTALLDEAEAARADPARFTELGLAFHVAIAEASGNRALAGTLKALRREEQALLAPRNTWEKADRAQRLHRRILDRIRDRDPDGARALMAAHVTGVAARVRPDLPRPAASTR